jgi:uncharacterized membrane protein
VDRGEIATYNVSEASTASMENEVASKLQRWFLTGIILIAPAYVTISVLLWLFRYLDGPVHRAIERVAPQVAVPGIGVAATLLLVLVTGAVASTILVRGLVRWFENVLAQIPLVRTIYSAIKQLLSPFSPEESAQLQRVVVVEWPKDGLFALGFLVKPGAVERPDGSTLSAVLLPSNHLHLGNVVLVPDAHIYPVDMTIEQGLKFLVSMGAGLEKPLQLGKALA